MKMFFSFFFQVCFITTANNVLYVIHIDLHPFGGAGFISFSPS